MSRGILILACLLGMAGSALGQSAHDPDEGLRIHRDGFRGPYTALTSNTTYTLSWWGHLGKSYFIQHSEDLIHWEYFPFVEPGADRVVSWGFTSSARRFFLRLEMETDPFHTDSDSDGMPDGYEVLNGLNPKVNDAGLDPDGDGLTNLQEFQAGTDPNDYYNGVLPVLSILGGDNQDGPPNSFLASPLAIQVMGASSNLLSNAPLTFAVTVGGAHLCLSNGAPPSTSLNLRSDAVGQASVLLLLPSDAVSTNRVAVTALSGSSTNTVWFTASAPDHTPPLVVIFSPEDRQWSTNTTLDVRGMARDNNRLSSVEVFLNGLSATNLACSTTNLDFSVAVNGLAVGSNLLQAIAHDLAGNAATHSVAVFRATEASDFDGDGVSDMDEINLYGTDPTLADTDGDGIPDAWEIAHSLNPLDPGDAALDYAGNGLANLQKYQQGKDPWDFYGGILPTLTILSGNNQSGHTNAFLAQPLVVGVATNGIPLTNAPVTFAVSQGNGFLASSTTDAWQDIIWETRSDTNGQASICFLLPAVSTAETNLISALAITQGGTNSVQFSAWALDETAPVIDITSPRDGLWTTNTLFDLIGVASDNQTVASLGAWLNGLAATNWSPSSASVAFDVGLTNLLMGTNVIRVVAADAAGHATTNTVNLVRVFPDSNGNGFPDSEETLMTAAAGGLETTDHAGADWIINTSTNLSGRHINVGRFLVTNGVTVTVSQSVGKFWVEAQAVDVRGTIDASGGGGAGASAAGGGGARGDVYYANAGRTNVLSLLNPTSGDGGSAGSDGETGNGGNAGGGGGAPSMIVTYDRNNNPLYLGYGGCLQQDDWRSGNAGGGGGAGGYDGHGVNGDATTDYTLKRGGGGGAGGGGSGAATGEPTSGGIPQWFQTTGGVGGTGGAGGAGGGDVWLLSVATNSVTGAVLAKGTGAGGGSAGSAIYWQSGSSTGQSGGNGGAGGSGCGGGILLRGGVVNVTGTLDASGGPGGTIKFFAGTGLSTNGATLAQGRLSAATGIPTVPAAVGTGLKDSDNDGLSDYDEVFVYGTNPNNADTDGDGLSDGTEVWSTGTSPTNPASTTDPATGQPVGDNADSDGDGLTDIWEIANSLDPHVANLHVESSTYNGVENRVASTPQPFYTQSVTLTPPPAWSNMDVRAFVIFPARAASGIQKGRVVDDDLLVNGYTVVSVPSALVTELAIPSQWSTNSANVVTATSPLGSGQYEFLAPHYFRLVATPRPKVEIAVDANRDGAIEFGDQSPDKTSSTNTFRFWLNNDSDSNGYDKQGGAYDSSDGIIASTRDLEDFARIQIKADPEVKGLIGQGYKLVIETTGGLQINMFKAATAGTSYLTSETVAYNQTSGSYRDAVNLDNLNASIRDSQYGSEPIPFIFEGKTAGEGVIRLVLKSPSGTVVASSEVHVKLQDIKDMYERAHATPDPRFRLPYFSPYTYEEPTVGYVNDTPNFQAPVNEDRQCVIFVHGINMSHWDYENFSETMFKRLWHQGFKGRFASFRWPTPVQTDSIDTILGIELFALKYGQSMKGYLDELHGRLSGYAINVAAHSGGNVVTSEALKEGAVVDNYVLMQAGASASSYDSSATLDQADLLAADQSAPTPDRYRGYFSDIGSHVNGNIVNFYNPVDGVLETGIDSGIPFYDISYHKVQRSWKPVDPNGVSRYYYELSALTSWLIYSYQPSGFPLVQRTVANAHEELACVARSRTKAAGAEGGTAGVIRSGGLNLNNSLGTGNPGFGSSRSDHSAEFNRNIQSVNQFYQRLLEQFN